ncbi:MAG TPA: hypothetical protein VK929_08805 [Longimicrobiales bacterium]|nr:hypothetical protein [Longimicrobiales bacterium]
MTDRRYDEDEVREIFRRAAAPGASRLPAPQEQHGLTLEEVQSIGREVGIDPATVARAAASLTASRTTPLQRSMGMPVGVGRMVPLPRAPTDREWEQLVAELRSTFGARGRVAVQGGLREWSNGNLHACIEPAGGGYRLRMGTVKGEAAGMNAMGIIGMGAGVVTFAAMALTGGLAGGLADALAGPVVLGGGGAAALIANAVRLPRWASRRQRQMEHIAAHAAQMLEAADTAGTTDS